MIYEAYEQKILRIRKMRDTLYKYKFLILGIIVLIMSCVSGFLIAMGGIVKDLSLKSGYVYGETIRLNASAFMSKVRYEFREEDGEWSEKVPQMPGHYEARAVTNGSFNTVKYGKTNKFEIAQKRVSLQANGKIVYGDNPTLSVSGLVGSDKIQESALQFTFSDFQSSFVTAQLVKDSFKIVDWKGEDKTSAYDFGDTMSQMIPLTIQAKRVVLTFADAEKTYDAQPLVCEEYTTDTELPFGDTLEVESFASILQVGTVKNEASYTILDKNGEDISSRYRITVKKGTLKINARPITISTNTVEKMYDGTVLQDTSIVIGGDGLVDGEELLSWNSASIVDVGTVRNDFDFDIRRDGNYVTDQYDITTDFGDLTVTKRYVGVKAKDVTKVYDNVAETFGYEIVTQPIYEYDYMEDVEALYEPMPEVATAYTVEPIEGHTLAVSTEQMRKGESVFLDAAIDVGTYLSYVTGMSVFDEYGTDVTDNYEFVTAIGTVEITPRPILVSTDSMTKVYDGERINPIYHIQPDEGLSQALVDGHFELVGVEDVVSVGSYENKIHVSIWGSTGDLSSNYQITYQYGTLEITQRPILIRGFTKTKVYDGLPFENEYEILALAPLTSALVDGHELSFTTSQMTDIHVDEYANNPVVRSIRAVDGSDVTANYKVFIESGTLTITPRPLTVAFHSQKVYDGQPIVDGYTVLETLGVNDTIAIEPLKDSHGNYAIDVGMYANNRAISLEHTYYATSSGDTLETEDVTSNYEIAYINTTLEILPRPITVTLYDKTRPYTGEAFTYEREEAVGRTDILLGSEYTALGLVSGHVTEVKASGSQTLVGASEGLIENVAIFGLVNGVRTDLTHNYAITKEAGLLTVEKRSVVITPYPYSRRYNGTALVYPYAGTSVLASIKWNYDSATRKEMETLYGKALLSGDVLEAEVLPEQSIVDVGDTLFYIDSYRILNGNGVEVQDDYYNVCFETQTGRITQAQLTIKSADLQQSCQENAMLKGSASDCWISMGKLYNGHTIEFKVSENAYLDSVGTKVNQITEVRIYDGALLVGYLKVDDEGRFIEGNDSYYNYHVELDCGTLKMDP